MPAITATAPAKIILFGEHAVVYGRPAIAVPLPQLRARAVVSADPFAPAGYIRLQAPAIGLDASLEDMPADDPFSLGVHGVLDILGISRCPACLIRVTSTIPIAAGLGSGAAASVVLVRAFSHFLGQPLENRQVNDLVFKIEKVYHGTPSGIDNTVITYEQPVFYIKDQPIQKFRIARPLTLVIADTGIPSKTAVTVGAVRSGWQADPHRYEALFDQIGRITRQARQALETGEIDALGPLMNDNQAVLQELGVSSPTLENLIQAARQAGAAGAKLSGGGGGGNLIALAANETTQRISQELLAAGAASVLVSNISNTGPLE
ncbi:MAG: mevalonate kinase [Anaerolineales bacterium]|jgi:mevalonate kinase